MRFALPKRESVGDKRSDVARSVSRETRIPLALGSARNPERRPLGCSIPQGGSDPNREPSSLAVDQTSIYRYRRSRLQTHKSWNQNRRDRMWSGQQAAHNNIVGPVRSSGPSARLNAGGLLRDNARYTATCTIAHGDPRGSLERRPAPRTDGVNRVSVPGVVSRETAVSRTDEPQSPL